MIRVLIVDDSAFMRKLLTDLFNAEPDFSVIDTARNGKDAIEKVKRIRPDLITMDIEMPVLDGIKALEIIMQEVPTPIVMISSLTKAGAEATLRALSLGAVDFVAKTAGPISNIADISIEIIAKCRAAAGANFKSLAPKPSVFFKTASTASMARLTAKTSALPKGLSEKIVAIGTSTGGPRALQEVLTKLPGDFPCGIVVVQHMPPGFTKSLAERLNSLCAVTVKEAQHNDVIKPANVFIAPGANHMLVAREANKTVIKLNQGLPIGGHRPAVDPLLESVAQNYGHQAVGVILTGMGHDGTKGIQLIKNMNGYTIAEDKSTAVVYGMPKSAIELGVIDKIAPLPAIANEIIKAVIK